MNPKFLLAIESSCDDCAVAILNSEGDVLADVIHSQIKPHSPFGGIVPELASRQHLARIALMVDAALKQAALQPNQIEAIAATNRPGLIGSLLVGVQFAKGFAQAIDIPILGIHHIEGHLLAGFGEPDFPKPPFIGLIVSGGHSAIYLVDEAYHITTLGQTRDDAAGEAFDKIGRMLGLPYPAGKEIDALAQEGDAQRYAFPIAFRSKESLEYSFSGLKTAAKLMIEKLALNEQEKKDFCASLQSTISQTLLAKAKIALQRHNVDKLVIGGGVAANSRIRADAEILRAEGFHVYLPEKKHCTDNAVMIARAALRRFKLGEESGLDLPVRASSAY
ncbi:MAG: tRNA (adenosine(37)-N6)-threonylcarbamoyltransferase complex transferase subunit TsaD [Myxococcota bacterium]